MVSVTGSISCSRLNSTRVYNVHDPVYSHLELAALYVRSTPRRHTVWQRDARHIMGDTWWRQHFVPHVWAGQLSARTYQDLWRGKGSSTQPPEIQSPSRRIVGHFGICMDIPYYQGMTILGVRFAQALMQSSTLFWTVKPRKVKEEARKVYQTYLCLKQRIEYTHTIELALIWFVVQVFPISQENLRQLVTAILACFTERSSRCPLWSLGSSSRRGMDLVGVGAKCTSLFTLRCKHNTTCPAQWGINDFESG